MKKWIMALMAVAVLVGCKKEDDPTEQMNKERQIILDYIAQNNLDAKGTESGLFYVIDTLGTGKQIYNNSTVTVVYKGYFTDGIEFDASDADGSTFNVGQVIAGWQEGLQKFRQGGKGKLLIPSHLGYGKEGKGSIPGNSVLIFDIEVTRVF